ncbi:MAG: hypothetical protein JWP97_4325 [Labilithrix sp.]|nr:hypothetical protein [Labilithrix sp.]
MQSNAVVVAIAEVEETHPHATAVSRASVAGRADEVFVIKDENRGVARTALLARLAPGTVLLSLMAGETVGDGSWDAIAEFARGAAAVGRIRLVEDAADGKVRHVVPRLIRVAEGARFVGGLLDRPEAPGPEALVDAVVSGSLHAGLNRTQLADAAATSPEDPYLRLALASALLESQPALAASHAQAAVDGLDVASVDVANAVVLLARALFAAGQLADMLALAEACRASFPALATLPLLEGRALAALRRRAPMVDAIERCLAAGERDDVPGLVGAGSTLAASELAAFAASQGDTLAARRLHALAGTATRKLRIVACIPGREFSGRFFDAWNEFAAQCHAIGIELTVSRRYDAVVYYARNRVAGGNGRGGKDQAPWGGERDYDYMLWIDSDVIFTFADFQALLRHKVDVAAGLYLMADNARFAAVEKMDPEVFETTGEFEFLTPRALADRTGLVKVDYTGFGFVLVRKGVFERMSYPWFRPHYFEAPGGASDFTSEDVGFCLDARKAGIDVYVDPTVVVGHEKHVVLDPRR